MKLKLVFSLLLSLLFQWPAGLQAQGGLQMNNYIPLIHGGDTLSLGWAGGLNAPQFSTIDLDGDGLLDLFVFDRSEDGIVTFRNAGTATVPDYEYAPEFIPLFPDSLIEWALLRDYDGDGDEDLFTATRNSNIRVYHNDRDLFGGTLTFSLRYAPLKSRYPSNLPLYHARSDIPGIADYDGDGDLDFFTFEILGVNMEWHKNVAVDSGWGTDTLAFVLQSYCFGHFNELSTCGGVLNQTPCAPGMRTMADPVKDPTPGARHTGSTTLPIDLNADGLFEFILGDASCSRLYALFNTGTTSIGHFGSQEVGYPQANVPVQLDTFISSYYMELDGGTRDLLAAPNYTQFAQDRYCVWMYHNAGADNQPDFELQTKSFLQGEMIDVGTGSSAAFFDYDGDGDKDLLVANESMYVGGGEVLPAMHLYVNTGTAAVPAYTLQDTNYLDLLSDTLKLGASPTLGDLDDDGDEDLLLGVADGSMFYFKNNGGAGVANFAAPTADYQNIDVGYAAAPQLVDLDNDSDLDLLVGNEKGRIIYYKNIGSPSAPQFDSIDGAFGQVKINDFTGSNLSFGYARPCIADYDADGDRDLLVGSIEGEVQIYTDVTTTPGDTFPFVGTLLSADFGYKSTVAFAHIDTSTQGSLFIGSKKGGLRHVGPPAVPASVNQPAASLQVRVFPNPANESVSLRLEGPAAQSTQVSVVAADGRLLSRQSFTGNGMQLNVSEWPQGIYLLQLQNENGRAARRIVISH